MTQDDIKSIKCEIASANEHFLVHIEIFKIKDKPSFCVSTFKKESESETEWRPADPPETVQELTHVIIEQIR